LLTVEGREAGDPHPKYLFKASRRVHSVGSPVWPTTST
jgi:hypothetical protein